MLTIKSRVLGITPLFRVLTPKEEAALRIVEAYDFGKVRVRVLKDGAVSPEEVDEAIAEFRRFLALICLGNTGLAIMAVAHRAVPARRTVRTLIRASSLS